MDRLDSVETEDSLQEMYVSGDLELALTRIEIALGPWMRRKFIRRGVRDDNDIDDCMQSVMMRLVTHRNSFNPAKGNLKGWMYTMIHNVAYTFLHKKIRRKEISLDETFFDAQGRSSPEVDCMMRELKEKLHTIIAALPEREARILDMYIEGSTLNDIANALDTGTRVNTIKTILYKTISKLAEIHRSPEDRYKGKFRAA